MRYRSEIDGLRAVAVLPVILSHAGFETFNGGFVGVDVFFVISGYLITSILIDELDRGDFSIIRFYERRARRILPALFVVVLACMPFAWAWMMPSQLTDFSESVMAVVLFFSNILFWLEEGYFSTSSALKPLLHTWSLAVEEQFYVFFPLFLVLIWRRTRGPAHRHALEAVLAVGVASFILSLVLERQAPSANFYLAPSRAWELMMGAACAFRTPENLSKWSGAASLAGLALIGAAVVGYDENTPFPGVYAMAPVVGTSLVILFAVPGTFTARILSTAPMIGIGLISYSAYLWHQPIFAFARLRSLTEPGPVLMWGLVALTLVLAWISWRWVEQPFRNPAVSPLQTQASVFAAAAGAAILLGTVGLSGHVLKGFPTRFSPEALLFVKTGKLRAGRECHFDENRLLTAHPQSQCRNPNAAGVVSVMILGDSHALALSDSLGKELSEAGIGYYEVSYGGCVPLAGFKRMRAGADSACSDFNEAAIRYAAAADIDTLVLMGRFPLYLYGKRFGNGEGGREHGDHGAVDMLDSPSPDERSRRMRVLEAYESRIRELAQRFKVVLVYPVPEAGWNVPAQAFRLAVLQGGAPTLSTSYVRYLDRTAEINDLFDRLAAELPGIYPARVQEALCSGGKRCLNADRSGAYYVDDNHLSEAGAQLVTPLIVRAVLDAESDRMAPTASADAAHLD
jgi:peptidoglycan/LPS O-acetylase OafA/YrhL